jgi:hypothetical protein
MMGTEMVPETAVVFSQPTRLIAREVFINICLVCYHQLLTPCLLEESNLPSPAGGHRGIRFLVLDSPLLKDTFSTLLSL